MFFFKTNCVVTIILLTSDCWAEAWYDNTWKNECLKIKAARLHKGFRIVFKIEIGQCLLLSVLHAFFKCTGKDIPYIVNLDLREFPFNTSAAYACNCKF